MAIAPTSICQKRKAQGANGNAARLLMSVALAQQSAETMPMISPAKVIKTR